MIEPVREPSWCILRCVKFGVGPILNVERFRGIDQRTMVWFYRGHFTSTGTDVSGRSLAKGTSSPNPFLKGNERSVSLEG